MPKSIVEELREKGEARLKEIRETVGPMVAEESDLASMLGHERHFHTAEETAEAVKQAEANAKPTPAPRAPQAPTDSEPNGSGSPPRRKSSRKGGTRADQAVKLVEERPGISASEVAAEMEIAPNYLYRVLGDLEKEGRVKKTARKYFPVAA